MRILYVMDPLERMHPEKDTTFAFMLSGTARGHINLHCLPRDLTIRAGRVYAHVTEATVSRQAPHFHPGASSFVALDEIDAVFIRKDPPFDQAYLYLTLCLERARGKTLIINDPRGLRDANEKIYATNFSRWMPETLVSSDREEIHAFVKDIGGEAVIKPLDGAGGAGVMMLSTTDRNARSIVDTLTAEGTRIAMVQAFLPKVVEGDKRVLLMDGEILGAILRVPRADDIRSNIHVGGRTAPTEITKRERELIEDITPQLKKDGLFFVGLDLIGEHLTEVNVTSPTGIQELGRFTKSHPEDRVIQWAEEHRLKKP
jgi:glutathione synthase